jgi:hypothetical protein
MTALKPIVHHTVTPTREIQAHGWSVIHGTGGTPNRPSSPFMAPKEGSSRYAHIRPITATPSTYGAKNTARKNVRPGNWRFSSTASPSGMEIRKGTLATVKIAVARMLFQNGRYCTDVGSNSAL